MWHGPGFSRYPKIFVMFGLGAIIVNRTKEVYLLYLITTSSLIYIAYEVNLAYLVDGRLDIYNRGYGGLDNNGAGLLLAMGIPLAIFAWESTRHVWRWVFLAGVPFLLHGVLMTYSRGAMLALIVGLPYTLARSANKGKALGVAVVLAALVPIFAGQEIRARFFSIEQYEEDKSANIRLDSWRAAFRIANDSPIYGVGMRNANLLAYEYGADTFGRTIHSQYFQLMADAGYVGLALYLLALGGVAYSLFRARGFLRQLRNDPEAQLLRGLASGLEGAMLVFCIGATFLSLEVFELPYLLALIASQIWVIARARAAQTVSDVVPEPHVRAPLPASGISPSWVPETLTAIRIGFVLHVMQVAGAEILVADTIRRLGSRIEPVVLCLDGIGQLGAEMQQQGVDVVALDRRPGINLAVSRRLARQISSRRLEVLHAHQYTPFFYTALAKLQMRQRFHLMFTEHGRHYPDVVSARRRLTNRLLLTHLADEINGVCAFSTNSLANVDGFGRRQIEVIENGIHLERYTLPRDRATLRRGLGLQTDRRYVVCIARFHPVKDHAMLLRAFRRVATQRPDVDLLLAGDGPLRDQLTMQVQTLALTDRVHFLGVRRDVPELLAASDLFALTSISEAASLTLLEAMASALPVVVTRVGGNPEIVHDGEHGFLVPRNDDEAAGEAMLRLLDNRELAGRLGDAGRARVSSAYRIETTIDRYFDRYAAAALRVRERTGGGPHA